MVIRYQEKGSQPIIYLGHSLRWFAICTFLSAVHPSPLVLGSTCMLDTGNLVHGDSVTKGLCQSDIVDCHMEEPARDCNNDSPRFV